MSLGGRLNFGTGLKVLAKLVVEVRVVNSNFELSKFFIKHKLKNKIFEEKMVKSSQQHFVRCSRS